MAKNKRKPAQRPKAKATPLYASKKFEGGAIGPIEGLPAPQNAPKNAGILSKQVAIAKGVRSRSGRAESEVYPDNPALRGQKISPVSDNATAHGYDNIADAPLYNLYDEMVDREPVIESALSLKVAYLLMRPQQLMLSPEYAEDTRAGAILEFVRKTLMQHSAFPELLWSLAIGVCQHGRSTVELTYKVSDDKYFIPDRFFHCHPGQFKYKRNGDIGLLTGDWGNENFEPVPDMKFVYAKNPALYDNPHGRSDLHVLRFLYWIKKKGYMNFVRMADKNGVPFIQIVIPEDTPNYEAVIAELEEALAGLTDDDALITKGDYEIKLHDRTSVVGEKLYTGLLQSIDATFVRSILGAELASTVTDRGARSLGEVHERTVLNKVLPLARIVERAINCLIRWLVYWNFGPTAPVPTYEFDTEEKTDSQQARETLSAAKELGLDIAIAQAQEWLGIRPPEPGEEILPKAAINPGIAPNPGETDTPPEDNPPPDEEDDPEEEEDTKAAAITANAYYTHNELVKAGEEAFTEYLSTRVFSHLWEADSAFGVAFREAAAERAKARQAALSDQVEAIGQAGAKDTAKGLQEMVADLKKELSSKSREEPLNLYRTKALVDPGILKPYTDEAGRRIAFSVAFLSLGMTAEGLKDVRADAKKQGFAETDYIDGLPDDFRDAVEWMASREVMTVEAVRHLAQTIAEELGVSWKEIERGLRSEVLALAGTTNTAGTLRVQKFISDSVAQGASVGDFLDNLDTEFGLGDVLPEGQNAYWNNVFRTETANAYSAQQEEHEANPDIQENLWGHEMYNPKDKRSRKSHARLSGLRFRKGSPAWQTLGNAPFAYQCRCVRFALMAPGGKSNAFQESGDALSAAANIQRF